MNIMNNIKIDELCLNIPYDETYQVESNQELAKKVIIADKLSWLFKSNTFNYGHNGYTFSYNFGSGEQGGNVSIMWNESRKDTEILIGYTATDKALYDSPTELRGFSIIERK